MSFVIQKKKDVEIVPFVGIHMQLHDMSHSEALDALMQEHPEISDVQIFTHGPANIKRISIEDSFREALEKHEVTLWTHGSYLCVPWKNPFLSKHTLANIRASRKLDSKCVVVHIPFQPVDYIINGIRPLVKAMRKEDLQDTVLMLETSATVKDETRSYESPEKLNRLTKAVYEAKMHDCVRICIDTAHIFAGKANVSGYEDARQYIKRLDKRLIGMIQLNDSSIDPNVRKGDKHEVPLSGAGLMWGHLNYEDAGCRAFVELSLGLNIPFILEINRMHKDEDIRKFINEAKKYHLK